MGLLQKIKNWERDIRAHYNTDLSTPEHRRRARIYNLWFDHEVLRIIWTNHHEIAPGVYRSNQPTHKRFARLKEQGFKTILNLRGAGGAAHYLVEEESCRELGLTLVSTRLHARRAATREEILDTIAKMKSMETPVVMHCKSGADRAGFASAIYLMVFEGKSVAEARKMLSLRFIHLKWSKTGILDHILESYDLRNARDPISFEDWIRTEYDQQVMQSEFNAGKAPHA
jgi:protein tyrosine/serine phosphatase